jgi:hypothetical protein
MQFCIYKNVIGNSLKLLNNVPRGAETRRR